MLHALHTGSERQQGRRSGKATSEKSVVAWGEGQNGQKGKKETEKKRKLCLEHMDRLMCTGERPLKVVTTRISASLEFWGGGHGE